VTTLSYDEALAALQELEATDKLTAFAVGDIVHGLVAQGGPQVCKRVAVDLGRSLAWVRQRDLVAEVFPPDVRTRLWHGEEPPPPVVWRHHWVAAGTDDPEGWLLKAIANEWSTRQLEEAINGEDPDAPDDVLVTVDAPAGEVHVRYREGTAAKITDAAVPGVSHVLDAQGRVLATRLRLPAECAGRKVRLRRAR